LDLIPGFHTGPRHVNRRIRGRTHGSTRTRFIQVEKILLASTGASTHDREGRTRGSVHHAGPARAAAPSWSMRRSRRRRSVSRHRDRVVRRTMRDGGP
jgi:hypothetical protein